MGAQSLKPVDALQTLRAAFNETESTLNVTPTGGASEAALEDIKTAVESIDANGATAAFQIVQSGKLDTIANKINSVQLFTLAFDSITAEYPSATQEIYKSRTGGTSGTVVQTVTINYTDATKNLILNVART